MTDIQQIREHGAVDALVAEIVDPGRTIAIVGLTSRRGETTPALDPDEAAAALGGTPRIVTIADGPLTRRVAQLLTPELAVYGGAARIWWPGANRQSDPQAHPLIFERHGVYGSLALRRLGAAYDRGPGLDEQHGQDSVSRASLKTAEEARRSAETRAEGLQDLLAAANREVERLTAELQVARSQNTKLRRELRTLQRGADQLVSTMSPVEREGALREAIRTALRDVDAPEDRLAGLVFGPEFVRSALNTHVPLERIAWVCAFVIGRAPEEMVGLDLHPLRTGRGGSDPQRVRTRDGARAWRIAVRRGTPGAARLHFWRLQDGRVELASVSHHDNMEIPE